MTVETSPSLPIPNPAAPEYDGKKSVETLHRATGAKADLLVNRDKVRGLWTTIRTANANKILPTGFGTSFILKQGDLLRTLQRLCTGASIPKGGIV